MMQTHIILILFETCFPFLFLVIVSGDAHRIQVKSILRHGIHCIYQYALFELSYYYYKCNSDVVGCIHQNLPKVQSQVELLVKNVRTLFSVSLLSRLHSYLIYSVMIRSSLHIIISEKHTTWQNIQLIPPSFHINKSTQSPLWYLMLIDLTSLSHCGLISDDITLSKGEYCLIHLWSPPSQAPLSGSWPPGVGRSAGGRCQGPISGLTTTPVSGIS